MPTNVKIIRNAPCDSTYTDVLKFSSISAQTAYFTSKAMHTVESSYQRINSSVGGVRVPSSLRVPLNVEALENCNYIMWQNTDKGQKWYYAFIKQLNHISNENTEIMYELDYYQTYQFDYTVLPSFVVQEHVNSDKIGEHLQAEPVDAGTPQSVQVVNSRTVIPFNPVIVVCTSTDPDGTITEGQITDGIYSGLKFSQFTSAGAANAYISQFADKGRLENVVTVFMSPFGASGSAQWTPGINLTPGGILGEHVVRNNKLFTSQFTHYELSNVNGEWVSLYPENFYNTSPVVPVFSIDNLFGLPPISICLPVGYENQTELYLRAVSYSDYPLCPWSGNVYANWASKNMGSLLVNVGQVVGGVATGNIGQALGGAANLAGSIYSSTKTPVNIQNSPIASNYNFAKGRLGFELRLVTCQGENLRAIDSYFDMYGYTVNTLKVPNETGRAGWNYVRTNNVGIKAADGLPVDALAAIKNMYNSGVRFWHGDVGNYAQSNAII